MLSKVMQEIRQIRDQNSLKRLSMTKEERTKDNNESLEWFICEMSKINKKNKILKEAK